MLVEFSHRLTSGPGLLAVVVLSPGCAGPCGPGHPRAGLPPVAGLMLTEAAWRGPRALPAGGRQRQHGAGAVHGRAPGEHVPAAREPHAHGHFVSGGRPVRVSSRPGLAGVLAVGLAGLLLGGRQRAIAALGDTLSRPRRCRGDRGRFSASSHVLIRLRLLHPRSPSWSGWRSCWAPPGFRSAPVIAGVTWPPPRSRPSPRCSSRGVLNILLLAPVWMQLVHLLVADGLWIAFVLLAASALAKTRPPRQPRCHARLREKRFRARGARLGATGTDGTGQRARG